MKRKDRIILKTAMATLLLLLFFFAQGAIVVITGIEGIPSALIRGAVIWGLVIITLVNSIIRYCKCQYKNVVFLSYKHVGKPTCLYDIFSYPQSYIASDPLVGTKVHLY